MANTVARTFVDPDQAAIQRRQRLADVLAEQSAAPSQNFSFQGYQAPIPATEGLAKVLAGFGSGYLEKKATEENAALHDKYRTQAQEFLADLQRGKSMPSRDLGDTDAPGSFPLMPGAMEQDGRAVMPGQQTPYSAQERQARAAAALGSNNPYLAQVAPLIYASAEGQMTRDADREFRAGESEKDREIRMAEASRRAEDRRWEIEQRLNDARTSRQEAADLKRELAAMGDKTSRDIASMRANAATGKLTPAAEKELFETEDGIQSGTNVMGAIDQAMALNNTAYDGALALTRAQARANTPVLGPSAEADATINMDNIITGQALESLKATFGGMPTEGERKILLEMQASVNKTKAQRKDILERARKAAERRVEFNKRKAEAIRSGDYKSISYSDTAAPVASPVVNSADQEAMNWAKSNPNDPRSAEIMKRLGGQ